ncbi:aldo/keto reductase [Puteibacter caeruleilacunae]|nr:aldo/keto reductase [Puteibacter caeruleilacunae]
MNSDFTRTLGKSGIEVSALGLGCWAIGGQLTIGEMGPDSPYANSVGAPLGWGRTNDNESIRAIHAAIDTGINFFDTADVYGAGHSEILLAKALKGKRHEVVIATKFGMRFDTHTREWTGINGTPRYIRRAIEASLDRLDTEYIDLYQFHIPEYDEEDAIETRNCLEELIKEGKIRGYAWSTDILENAHIFADGEHCCAMQQALNVFSGNRQLLRFCEQNSLASINRSPLAMGILTGKFDENSVFDIDDVRINHLKFFDWFTPEGGIVPTYLKQLNDVRDILTSDGRTLAQGAISWLWGLSKNTIPIPGFKSVRQVLENAEAMMFGPLKKDQIKEIDRILRRKHEIQNY